MEWSMRDSTGWFDGMVDERFDRMVDERFDGMVGERFDGMFRRNVR